MLDTVIADIIIADPTLRLLDDDPRERTTLEIPAETTQQLADRTWLRLRGEEPKS